MSEAKQKLIELASALATRNGFIQPEEAIKVSKRQMAGLLDRQDKRVIELAYQIRTIADLID